MATATRSSKRQPKQQPTPEITDELIARTVFEIMSDELIVVQICDTAEHANWYAKGLCKGMGHSFVGNEVVVEALQVHFRKGGNSNDEE